jgi:spore maturation protein CgeB
MKIVVFGLTITSSWGNGHATLWRGLLRALRNSGCQLVFYERDVPYYAATRDLIELAGVKLVLYEDWNSIRATAKRDVFDCDAAIVTSYCADALVASELVAETSSAISVFYDLDTPVTLSRLSGGQEVSYIGPRGLRDYHLVLSFTGGEALQQLRECLGARQVAPLYGHVDPEVHRPSEGRPYYAADLSYLGTYSRDRQIALRAFFIAAAQQRPERRFLIGGAQYPSDFPWHPNIYFVHHTPPAQHATFFSSSRLTLNVTREPMRRLGWCPSGRLFEAAACGTPVISDCWQGLDSFYADGSEILIARSTEDVIAALELGDGEVRAIGQAARARTLATHTSTHRAAELLALLEGARHPAAVEPVMEGA